eukprot:snap_masked-scaffold_33-processed-gene-3.27-mRNA-1 protein AED:1.00 eAED:1.00 QI:0/-1/0/0/-1/1/1/0/508
MSDTRSVPPKKSIYAKTYQLQLPSKHIFPEVDTELGTALFELDENSFGVCFSGNGLESLAATCGYLRVLSTHPEYGNLKYTSSVCCTSFATSLLSFSGKSENELFGKKGEYENLGEVLEPVCEGDFLQKITNFNGKGKEWASFLGEAYLRNFGLEKRLISVNEEICHEVPQKIMGFIKTKKKVNQHLKDMKFTKFQSNKSFCIFNLALVKEKEFAGIGDCFQVTPLYSGVPFYRDRRQMSYTKLKKDEENVGSKELEVYTTGGGVIESFAVNTLGGQSRGNQYFNARRKDSKSGEIKQFQRIEEYFYLEDVLGISSSNLGKDCSQEITYAPFFSREILAVNRYQKANKLILTSGQRIDNLGILSLLQRKIKKIICFMTTEVPMQFEEGKKYVEWEFERPMKVKEQVCCLELLSLFGVVEYGLPDRQYFDNQVFRKSSLDEVLSALQGKGWCNVKLDVLPNSAWNIEDTNDVDVTFVYNHISSGEFTRDKAVELVKQAEESAIVSLEKM